MHDPKEKPDPGVRDVDRGTDRAPWDYTGLEPGTHDVEFDPAQHLPPEERLRFLGGYQGNVRAMDPGKGDETATVNIKRDNRTGKLVGYISDNRVIDHDDCVKLMRDNNIPMPGGNRKQRRKAEARARRGLQ